MNGTTYSLEKLVFKYGVDKGQLDMYKKDVEEGNALIKKVMSELGVTECQADKYKVTKIIQTKESMNEEGLLEFAKTRPELLNAIRTREYIDFDALESMIYNGEIPAELIVEIGKFKQTKEIETLRLKILKEK